MADAKKYVAYTELGQYKPGDVVNPTNWGPEEWRYMVEHEVVVPQNSPNDPNVLAEKSSTSDRKDIPETPGSVSPQVSEAMKAYEAAGGESKADEKKAEEDKAEQVEKKDDAPKASATTPPPVAKPVAKPAPKPDAK